MNEKTLKINEVCRGKTSRINIRSWENGKDYGIIDQIHRKRYLWTFQKFVKKLMQIVKN